MLVYTPDEMNRIDKLAFDAAKKLFRTLVKQGFDEPGAAYGIALTLLTCRIFDEVGPRNSEVFVQTHNKLLERRGHPWRLVMTS